MPPVGVTVLDHPLARHLLTTLRDERTAPEQFRQSARTLATLLLLRATEDLATAPRDVRTPMGAHTGETMTEPIAAIPVLRAGLALLEPVLDLFADVAVGYVGLERDETTAVARAYYANLPKLSGRLTLVLDPMLATGGSAGQTMTMLKAQGATRIRMVCVVAAPEGVTRLRSEHPDVEIVTAAVDEGLDPRSYIVPGLGDFGDRLFGTG
ncbi:MAG: uracil phosphoribosyltransferase [Chloroflexota bacterium]